MNKSDERYEDDSDDKHNVSLSAEESEDMAPGGNDAMDTQDYDTRSETGSSSLESSLTGSDSESCKFSSDLKTNITYPQPVFLFFVFLFFLTFYNFISLFFMHFT